MQPQHLISRFDALVHFTIPAAGSVPLAAEVALPDIAVVSLSTADGLCKAIETILVQASFWWLRASTLSVIAFGLHTNRSYSF